MMLSILDLIILPIEDKIEEKKVTTKGFRDLAIDSNDMIPR